MIKNEKISFERGSILTTKMLDTLYSFPKDLLDAQYACYSNGILSGLEVCKRESWIITKGMLKFENEYYISKDDIPIEELLANLSENTSYYICLKLYEQEVEKNIVCHYFEPVIVNDLDKQHFKLGQFRYTKRNLIEQPETLHDLQKNRRNVFDALEVNQAGYTYPTLSSSVCKLILESLMQKEKPHPIEATLVQSIASTGVVPIQMLKYYVKHSVNKEYSFDALCEAIEKPYIDNCVLPDDSKARVKEFYTPPGGML